MFEVACICAMGCPSKTIIATRKDSDTSFVHFFEHNLGVLELLLVTDLFGLLEAIAESSCFVERGVQPIDAYAMYQLIVSAYMTQSLPGATMCLDLFCSSMSIPSSSVQLAW